MGKGVFFIIALLLISIPFICASSFGYNNPNLPHLKKIEEYISKTGDSATGTFNFNGGWMNNGLSIIGGKIYAQTGYFYNITSLNVTRQNLTVIENLTVGGHLFSSGVGDNYFLGNVGIGTTNPSQKLHIKSTTAGLGLKLDRAGTGNDAFIHFATGGTTDWFVGLDNSPVVNHFQIKTTNNAIPEFIIKTSGNVGIGTSSPQNTLNVIGDLNATGDIYSNNYQVLSYQRTVNVKNVTMTAVI